MSKFLNKKNKQQNPNNKQEKKYPFSKVLLIQESILVWLVTISCLVMAFICIFSGSFVELPWITAMVGCPWAAYAITQNAYYKKSMAENTQGGIVYDSAFGAKTNNFDNLTNIPVG